MNHEDAKDTKKTFGNAAEHEVGSPSNCWACGTRPELYTNNKTLKYQVSCYANDANAIEDGVADDWCEEEVETNWCDTPEQAWKEWEELNTLNVLKEANGIVSRKED